MVATKVALACIVFILVLNEGSAKKKGKKSRKSYSPDDPNGDHTQKGIEASNKGDHESAIASFGAAVRFNQYSGEAHSNLGVAYMRANMMDEAAASVMEAIRLEPNNNRHFDNLRDLESHFDFHKRPYLWDKHGRPTKKYGIDFDDDDDDDDDDENAGGRTSKLAGLFDDDDDEDDEDDDDDVDEADSKQGGRKQSQGLFDEEGDDEDEEGDSGGGDVDEDFGAGDRKPRSSMLFDDEEDEEDEEEDDEDDDERTCAASGTCRT